MSKIFNKKYIAECIGTFVLTLFGCGTAVVSRCSTANIGGYLATAFAFGLSIVAMAYSIGNISGCHLNPAVSFAMFLRKKLSGKDFLFYSIYQIVGAIVAGAALCIFFNPHSSSLGANALYQDSILKSMIAEIILTFVFVLCICGVTSKVENSAVAGLVIGGALVFVHLFGIGLTGTSVNPARSIGPAIFAGVEALKPLWVFIVSPMIGGGLAALCYDALDK